jgi:hypothetical protein
MKPVRICLSLAALLLSVPAARAAGAEGGLRFSWAEPDHASGIYHPTEIAKLWVVVENPTKEPLPLAGEIAFGTPTGATLEPFKALSVTPITATTVAPGQRAKLPLTVTFGNVGTYELRHRGAAGEAEEAIGGAGELPLTCIFAPRTPPQPITASRHVSQWVLPLPAEGALRAGYLTDLAKQTSVSTFLLDERFRYDGDTKIALAAGASIAAPAEKVEALFAEAAQLRVGSAGGVVLRVSVPVTSDAAAPEILGAYITDAWKRLHGALRGLVVVPQVPENSPLTAAAARDRFHVLYLAAYKAAKAADKDVVMLGVGTAAATGNWLVEGDNSLSAYVDAVALSDATQFGEARAVLPRTPTWVLPAGAYHWGDVPAAAALAEGAAMVGLPAPVEDRGATAHLLGGSVLFQVLRANHPEAPDGAPGDVPSAPFMAVFQGDNFSVAAIAGVGAGTALDVRYPGLAAGKTVVAPTRDPDVEEPAYANVQVPNDQRSLRVVDGAGAPVDCKVGDMLYVPATEKMVYLLGAGKAEDLAALLRPAPVGRMPIFDFALAIPPDVGGEGGGGLTLRMTNISEKDLAGTVRVFRPTGEQQGAPAPLATRDFGAVGPGKSLDVFLDAGPTVRAGQPLVLEFVTPRLTQRTGLILH